MNSKSSDHRGLSESQAVLVEKATEVLKAGGQLADTLSIMIEGAHRGLRRGTYQAESRAETGAGAEGEGLPAEDKSKGWGRGELSFDQTDKFQEALDHLEIIYELLVDNGNDHFSGLSSLLRCGIRRRSLKDWSGSSMPRTKRSRPKKWEGGKQASADESVAIRLGLWPWGSSSAEATTVLSLSGSIMSPLGRRRRRET